MTHPIHPAYGPCDKVFGTHCGECLRITNILAARAEKAEWAADMAQKAQDLLAARHVQMEEKLAATERELERWKHNLQVEGDYVCPDSLRADAAERRLTVAREALRAVEDYLAAIVIPEMEVAKTSMAGGLLGDVRAALKDIDQ